MADKKQNSLMAVGLISIIVIALFFVIRTASPKKPSETMADWTCEKHGYQFVAPVQLGPIKCPKHGGEAVRTVYYECSVHNHVFEAYRVKPANPVRRREENEQQTYEQEEMLYKVPDGEWTKEFPKIVCPHGNDDRRTLKYSPPMKI